jgi:hypothetical protein
MVRSIPKVREGSLQQHIGEGCGGYLNHPFLKNDTRQENNQAL